MMTQYKIGGMTCGGCAKAVTRAIESLSGDGVIHVEVDVTAGIASVSGPATEDAVGTAVREAGFEFEGKVEA